jgi:succinate dehydrogenase hydrophobic anchor subunit
MRGARAALERSAADLIKRPLLALLKFHQVVGTRYINSDYMRKKGSRVRKSWLDLVVLTFLVLLFVAAIMANVSDGPMHEYRGAWVTRASR